MARGFTRDGKGRFRKGFDGLKPVTRAKIMATARTRTKARMDKQNLITRGTSGGSDPFPVKTNVKEIGAGNKRANIARATSARSLNIDGVQRDVPKGQRFANLEVKLSKAQVQRVEDYRARPARTKKGAAKKAAARGKANEPGKLPDAGRFNGRSAAGMSQTEKIEAYQTMHGKAPSAATLKRVARLSAENDKIKQVANERVKVAGDNGNPFGNAAHSTKAQLQESLAFTERMEGKNSVKAKDIRSTIRDLESREKAEAKAAAAPKVKADNAKPLRGKTETMRQFVEANQAPPPPDKPEDLERARKLAVKMGLIKDDNSTPAAKGLSRRQKLQRKADPNKYDTRPTHLKMRDEFAHKEAFAKQVKVAKADDRGRQAVTLNGRNVGSIKKRTEGAPVMSGRIKIGSRAPKGYIIDTANGRGTETFSGNRKDALEKLGQVRVYNRQEKARKELSKLKFTQTMGKVKTRRLKNELPAKMANLQAERYGIKELSPRSKDYREQRIQLTRMDSNIEATRRSIKRATLGSQEQRDKLGSLRRKKLTARKRITATR